MLPAGDGKVSPIVQLVYKKFYVDEIYDAVFVKPLNALSGFLYRIFDVKFIDGIVNSVSKGLTSTSGVIRFVQSGHVGFYIFAMVFGIIAIFVLNLIIK